MIHIEPSQELMESNVALTGSIDRVDRFLTNQSEYLRIIDYKSSAHLLEPAKIMGGLQLQLLMYFGAMLRRYPGSLPAGAFYFHINDPLVYLDEDDALSADQKIAASCRLNGIALEDPVVLQAMYDAASAPFSSISPPFTLADSYRKHVRMLNSVQWANLLLYVKEVANQFSCGIHNGIIHPYPVQYAGVKACNHCIYNTLCMIDPLCDKDAVRKLLKIEFTDFREMLSNIDRVDYSFCPTNKSTNDVC
jgi:ATP-dependent helicase/nuclease subunit B